MVDGCLPFATRVITRCMMVPKRLALTNTVLSVLFAALATRCGPTTPTPTPTDVAAVDSAADDVRAQTDSGAVDASSDVAASEDSSATDASGACNDLTLLGADVTITSNPAMPPTLSGGAITDGTYVLTQGVAYGRPAGVMASQRTTLRIGGARWNFVTTASGTMIRQTFDVTLGPGAQLRSQLTCPVATAGTLDGYSATGTQLMLLDRTGILFTFERQ